MTFKNSNNKQNIEVEKKYIVSHIKTFEKVENLIMDLDGYEMNIAEESKIQKDYYYDTSDFYLLYEHKTLRFREIENKLQLTIKTPTKKDNMFKDGKNTQNERFEYEEEVDFKDEEKNKDKILKCLPELKEAKIRNSLNKTLTIVNNRRTRKLTKADIEFEIAFDDVEYINTNGKKKKEYQIEIELKSDYNHRKNLKRVSDYLEENISELKPSQESKYRRGLRLTK